jgi:hypothetical protein
LLTTLPLINPLIGPVSSYPNIVPRNSDSHLGIEGNRGEFLGFSNLLGNPFPSPEGYGSFAALAFMQP